MRTRNVGINIRVSEKEKEKIARNAKKTKLSISEYLRKLAVGHKPKELPSEEIQTELIKMKEIIMLLDYQTKMFSGDELKAAVIKTVDDIGASLFNVQRLMLHQKTAKNNTTKETLDGDN